MSRSVSELIGESQLGLPFELTASNAFAHMKLIHLELCMDFPIYVGTVSLNLVAGQRTYALAPTITSIRTATYFTSATQSKVLYGTHVDQLDADEDGWRSRPSATPSRFFIDAALIGFVPKPAITTAGSGYPKVDLEVTQHTELTQGGTTPNSVINDDVYTQGIRYRAALSLGMAEPAALYFQAYMQQKLLLERHLGTRNRRFHRYIQPDIGMTISVI